MQTEGKWIKFELFPLEGRKTNYWSVWTKDDSVALGVVKWYGPWRCYSFVPQVGTVFEKQCLRDIAQFCEEATIEHRQIRKKQIREK